VRNGQVTEVDCPEESDKVQQIHHNVSYKDRPVVALHTLFQIRYPYQEDKGQTIEPLFPCTIHGDTDEAIPAPFAPFPPPSLPHKMDRAFPAMEKPISQMENDDKEAHPMEQPINNPRDEDWENRDDKG
jgi:hypothetical protein